MRVHYIYKTTNLINGKAYIGQRFCSEKKTPETDVYFGSGNYIVKALKKHGKENFKKEVLEVCISQKDADLLEKKYMDMYEVLDNKDKWYNRAPSGQYNRQEKHSEFMSSIMKKFYSDSVNVNKSTAARMGITIKEYELHKARKVLIKKLKKIKVLKKKEESRVKKLLKKKARDEYFASDEYKNKMSNKRKVISLAQSNSEDFKRKVRDGNRKAELLNPGRHKIPVKHDIKIQMSKSKLGDKASFVHHLFWDKNMSIGMASKKHLPRIKSFLCGYSSYRKIDYRIFYIHEALKEMDMDCDIKKLIDYAHNEVFKKRGERREKMNVKSYAEAGRLAGVSRQRICGLKKEHFTGKKIHNYFVYDPKTSDPGINIDDKDWVKYANNTNSQRVKQKIEKKTIKSKSIKAVEQPPVNQTKLIDSVVKAIKDSFEIEEKELTDLLELIEKYYEEG